MISQAILDVVGNLENQGIQESFERQFHAERRTTAFGL
jgi:hypothetical protein